MKKTIALVLSVLLVAGLLISMSDGLFASEDEDNGDVMLMDKEGAAEDDAEYEDLLKEEGADDEDTYEEDQDYPGEGYQDDRG